MMLELAFVICKVDQNEEISCGEQEIKMVK